MIFRARIVLPITAPPVEDGAVLISGDRIQWVGAWKDLAPHASVPVEDLGEVILLPGLVNAHCHLEYTHLAGVLTPPKSFPDWIKSILTAKSAWGFSDYALSWIDGARQLLQSGTTTVADIASIPELLDVVRPSTPLRVHSFLEMTGIRSRRPAEEIVSEAAHLLSELPGNPETVGLSPHALYSTMPELLEVTARVAAEKRWKISMHVAESISEFEMFMYARGPMFDWLAPQRARRDCGTGSPVRICERHGILSPSFIAAHVNYLWQDDAHRLASHGAHVAHCPQSHAYFRHHRFPRVELQAAGVNVCLGTDSLASTRISSAHRPRLSLFDEMTALSHSDSVITPREILELSTRNGARALGWAGLIGGLAVNSLADFITLPYLGPLSDAEARAASHTGNVQATWLGGDCVWRNPDRTR